MTASAQEPAAALQRILPDTAWQRLAGPPQYPYRNSIESADAPLTRPSASLLSLLAALDWFNTPAGQALLWTVFSAAVLYTAYRALTGRSKFAWRSRKTPTTELPAAPDEPLDADWRARAEAAAARGDYRSATRFSYRLLLQRLADAGLIRYEAGKSDAGYAHELQPTPHQGSFRALLRRYERAWFGDYPVSSSEYAAFQAGLQDLLQHLPR